MSAPIEPMRSLHDLARLTGLHEEGLRRALREGRGPRHYRLGNRLRFRQVDIDDWLRAHARGGADSPA